MLKFTKQLHHVPKKTVLGMFFMFLCAGAFAQVERETFSATFSNEPLSEALMSLEDMGSYRFVMNYGEVDGYYVTTSFNNLTMRNALTAVLTGLPFEYTVEGLRVTIKKVSDATNGTLPPEHTVTGRVTDPSGLPLAGVSIVVEATTKGTHTDADGHYSITVPTGATLTFSYVGFGRQSIPVGARSELNVTMEVEVQRIGDVVVTGYQTISAERAGGAYSIIGGDELEKKPTSNISNALIGMVPGLATLRQTVDGQNRFIIRGLGTFTNISGGEEDGRIDTDPLVVVDGFPIQGFTSGRLGGDGLRNSKDPFSTINPNDVESITVLKDAAATSIYGARAANGVIVITTKKGKTAERLDINITGFVGISSRPDLDYAFSMASTESTFWYLDHLKQYYPSYNNTWFDPYNYMTDHKYVYINDAAALMLEYGKGNITETEFNVRKASMLANDGKWKKDLDRLVYRNAVQQQYNVSLRGGSVKSNYSLSVAYDSEDTYQKGNDSRRIMANLRNSFQLTKDLRLNIGANGSIQDMSNNGIPLSTLRSAVSPWTRLVDNEGNYNYIASSQTTSGKTVYLPLLRQYEDRLPASWFYNPVQDRKQMDFTSERFNVRLHAGLDYRIVEGLNISASGQYERNQYSQRQHYKPESYYIRNYNNIYSTLNPATDLYETFFPAGGAFNQRGDLYEGYILRGQADFNRSFGRHALVMLAGSEAMSSTHVNEPTMWRYGYNEITNGVLSSVDYVRQFRNIWGVNAYMPYAAPGSIVTLEDRFFSAYVNAAYTLDGKYTLTASARTEASNFQAKSTRDKFSPFWSVAGVWLISREKFMEDAPWVDYLKLRASVGEAGFAAGRYNASAVTTLSSSSGSIQYSNNEPYNSISARGNPTLTWQRTRDTDLGLEFRLWGNKLSGNITYYNRYSYDALSNASVPIIAQGTTSATFNNAAISNNGIELSLGSKLTIAGELGWSGLLNLAYNKNTVRKYNVINTSTRPAYYPGYSVRNIWVFKMKGYTDEGYMILQGKDGTEEIVKDRATTHQYDALNGAAGDKVEDYNWVYSLGNSTPSTNLGFTGNFTYKGLTLSFMVTGKFDYYFASGNSFGTRQDTPSYSKVLDKAIKVYNEGYGNQKSYSVLPLWNDANKDVFTAGSTWMYMTNLVSYASNYYLKGDHLRLQEVYLGYDIPGRLLGGQNFVRGVNVYFQARNLGLIWSANREQDPDYSIMSIKPLATFTFGLKLNFN